MTTNYQKLGEQGEKLIAKKCVCPKCKNKKTLKRLGIKNFKCADIICDFCGYLAQVKTSRVTNVNNIPNTILGAAWKPQLERMNSGIFFPLYLVLIDSKNKNAIYYLSADLQTKDMFKPRKPLSSSARRAGWQGFIYKLDDIKERFIKIL